jgi:hypothetical protein
MDASNLNKLIDGRDATVELEAKTNISALDYIMYCVSCMYSSSNSNKNDPKSIFVLTIHDASSYDSFYTYNENFGDIRGTDKDGNAVEVGGPYFKVSQISYNTEKSDAYELNIGYNTPAIVTQFSLDNNENYALYYEHQMELAPDEYVRRINNDGKWEDVYAPTLSSKNKHYLAEPNDQTW